MQLSHHPVYETRSLSIYIHIYIHIYIYLPLSLSISLSPCLHLSLGHLSHHFARNNTLETHRMALKMCWLCVSFPLSEMAADRNVPTTKTSCGPAWDGALRLRTDRWPSRLIRKCIIFPVKAFLFPSAQNCVTHRSPTQNQEPSQNQRLFLTVALRSAGCWGGNPNSRSNAQGIKLRNLPPTPRKSSW